MSRDERTRQQRDRVLHAAARLFAQQGYSGTGMRQLAAEAGVSLSMINYYFGSKAAVLEQLVTGLHEVYFETIRSAFESADTIEEKIRAYVRAAVEVARTRPHELRCAFTELPDEVPEIAAQKIERLRELTVLWQTHILAHRPHLADLPVPVLGPAVGQMIASHFMVRPMLQKVLGDQLVFDDAFYARYAEQIADLLLYGLLGPRPSPPVVD
ncbi:MAG: TetR/AcrR family transcriptional regulator [Myxococcales bacterium]|nr:TetR/AcrR family transcriptional regulator [Myxococcales bacterium]